MFEAKIRECSKELSAKERVLMKDISNCDNINELAEEAQAADASVIFKPAMWAIVDVHNDESKDSKDYTCYVIVTDDDRRLYTSSDAFYNAFISIVTEMEGSDEEWSIKVVLRPSSNYKGKNVLSCTIV